MTIVYACPACGMKLKSPEESVGKRSACPYCKATVTVPAAAPAIATSAEPRPQSGPQRVVLVGVEMAIPEMIEIAFKWSVAAFVVSLAWGLGAGAAYLFIRWATAT